MSNKAKIREEAKLLNPIDDIMFRKMAEDKAFCEEILRVILDEPELEVLEAIPQFTATNMQGRSAILDAKCRLGDDRQVNIEVQKHDNDDHQRRVRYNGALLTTNITDPGEKFEQVPDVWIVYISEFDLFNGNCSLYHINRVVAETGQVVENGFREIYVSAKVKDGSQVAELMELFVEDNAYSDKFPVTSYRKRLFKESEEGQRQMSGIMEIIMEQGRQEGRQEGQEELNNLYSLLIKLNRLDDLKRATVDEDYREHLISELLSDM